MATPIPPTIRGHLPELSASRIMQGYAKFVLEEFNSILREHQQEHPNKLYSYGGKPVHFYDVSARKATAHFAIAPLKSELTPAHLNWQTQRQALEEDTQRLRQYLGTLISRCPDFQDLRDIVPDYLNKYLCGLFMDIPRTRPSADLRDTSLDQDQRTAVTDAWGNSLPQIASQVLTLADRYIGYNLL